MSAGYLPDTPVFVDMSKGRRLSPRVRALLNDPTADLRLSVVSIVEMCIKANLGKLALPAAIATDPARGFQDTADKVGFCLLPLELRHAAQLPGLPMHYKDPFDRLLICQAMAEDLILVSDDSAFPLYSGLALLRS